MAETRVVLATPNDFNTAWDEVVRLIQVDAMHRKGYKLSQVPDHAFVFLRAKQEFNELRDALEMYLGSVAPAATHVEEEMADVLGCLFHLAIRLGITPESLSTKMLEKFKLRFTEGAEPEPGQAAFAIYWVKQDVAPLVPWSEATASLKRYWTEREAKERAENATS